ncbi:hypothetical protein CsSME_00009830 [Camellia sinensis var. sinensis]
MVLCNLSLALVCLMSLVLVHPSYAQNSQQDYLNAHNAARAQVGVGPMTWDNNVATYAQRYASSRMGDCNLVHSGGPYGENLAEGNGSFTGTAGVNLWVGEKPYYDYNSNSCVGRKECRHYTQVCTNNGWWFVICSYDPPGNYIGQRPY